MICPRCEGQKYDKESCGLCVNFGHICECGGRFRPTPIYYGGLPSWRCEECGTVVVDEAAKPVSSGKLIRVVGDESCNCGEREACSNPGCRGPYYDEIQRVAEAIPTDEELRRYRVR